MDRNQPRKGADAADDEDDEDTAKDYRPDSALRVNFGVTSKLHSMIALGCDQRAACVSRTGVALLERLKDDGPIVRLTNSMGNNDNDEDENYTQRRTSFVKPIHGGVYPVIATVPCISFLP